MLCLGPGKSYAMILRGQNHSKLLKNSCANKTHQIEIYKFLSKSPDPYFPKLTCKMDDYFIYHGKEDSKRKVVPINHFIYWVVKCFM